jgi:hypothetical protein
MSKQQLENEARMDGLEEPFDQCDCPACTARREAERDEEKILLH